MTIVPLRREHVRAVAALHVKNLTGLLHALGRFAARAFYAGSVKSPHMIAFVALEGDKVRGFVYGSMTPRALKLEALAMSPFSFTFGAALGSIVRPSVLPYVFEMLQGSSGPQDAGAPELTYLVVAPEARRSGLGQQLVDAFSDAMRNAGASGYELSVDQDNIGADRFYRRLGFKQVGRYHEFGAEHHRYRLELPARP